MSLGGPKDKENPLDLARDMTRDMVRAGKVKANDTNPHMSPTIPLEFMEIQMAHGVTFTIGNFVIKIDI